LGQRPSAGPRREREEREVEGWAAVMGQVVRVGPRRKREGGECVGWAKLPGVAQGEEERVGCIH
jgi:hypothetical protein